MSVRGARTIYREREVERDYDRDDSEKRTYTTVKRYQVPDRDSRSAIFDNDEVKEDKIVIRRERREDTGRGARSEVGSRVERFSDRERDYDRRDDRRDDVDIKITERFTEREREREPERRDVRYRVIERESDRDRDRYSGSGRSDIKIIEREREVTRATSPPVEERVREYRFERERDYSPARAARDDRPYDLERYSKSTEYFAQPQPIVIRESAPAPIIIREERREPQQIIIRREDPQYEFIEREEVREDRQLVRQEEPPPPPASTVKSVVKSSVKSNVQKEEEDYFYERRIREIDRGPRRRREEEVRPSDSASQYSSDDSYEYVRRERYVDGERDRSPNHKLHLAEGAIAGAGAAEIFRQHRKSQGRDSGHRGRDLLGGAALGAIAAEGISRAKSLRGTSRRRPSWDEDDRRSRRDTRRSRSRSRSKSKSRIQTLGGLAAVAAVGALAGYAIKKSGSNKETVIINESPRRSRSRRRRGSEDTYIDERNNPDSAQNPAHRNRRIAQAGLASAAAAGIWERFRSKSRGGRERSKSRIRTAAPIIGAGLGGAALAGLYERNKASKEATREAIVEDERNRGRRRASRSRSRSRAAIDGRRGNDNGMVAYGHDPIYPDDRGYYDEEPGNYRRRHRDGSAGSSPDTRRRSRSRNRGLAEAGLAAAGAAAVGHEVGRERERRRIEEDRRHDDYDNYDRHGYITPPPNDHQYSNQATYPQGTYFDPPPTGENAYREGGAAGYDNQNPYPPYNPATFNNEPAAAGATREAYPDQAAEAAAARERQIERESHQNRDAGNVSSPVAAPSVERPGASMDDSQSSSQWTPQSSSTTRDPPADANARADGLDSKPQYDYDHRAGSTTPRARSTSRVRFDLNSNVAHSPDELRRHRASTTDSSQDSRDRHHDDRRGRRRRSGRPSSTLMNDPHERRHESDSDDTIDLPDRFDQHGNRKPEGNDLAAQLSALFGGAHNAHDVGRADGRSRDAGGESGGLSDVLRGIAGELFHNNGDEERSGRRSRR